MRLLLPLLAFARDYPDQPALVQGERVWTAAQWLSQARQAAAVMQPSPGEVVALAGTPDLEWIAALAGIWLCGATAAPLSHFDPPGARARTLEALGPDRVWEAASGLPPLPGHMPGEHRWQPGQRFVRLLTSGSTGRPRRVDLRFEQVLAGAVGSLIRLGHRHDDRWLVPLPLHHVGGLSVLFRGMLNQITVEWLPRFDAETVAARLDAGEVSIVSLVPTMLQRVLDARPERPFPERLRAVLLGGAPCPAPLVERCRRLGVPLARTWGMTETAAQVATERPGEFAVDGLPPLPLVEIAAAQGRLFVEGPQAGAKPLRSGDRGEVIDGRVRVAGRADRMILRGGENVDPDAIAQVLATQSGVDDVAVVGLPDPELGARVIVAIVASPERIDVLRTWATHELPRLQRPDVLLHFDALPRNSLGKIDWKRLEQAVRERMRGQTTETEEQAS